MPAVLWQVRVEWETTTPDDTEAPAAALLDYLASLSAGAIRHPTPDSGGLWGTHVTVRTERITHAVRRAVEAVVDASTAAGLTEVRVMEVEAHLMPAGPAAEECNADD